MNFSKNIDGNSANNLSNFSISIIKITALWAFSESAFGGILHALTIPLRGIFINAAAVLFISLISLFSKNNKDILKSTIIVILIKALVSPHSPLTAYFSVGIQGILGYLLFSTKKFYAVSSVLLGILTLFFSGIQKIVVLTFLFGNTLWRSLNIFIDQVFNEFLSLGLKSDLNYGYLLMSVYVSIHVIAGIFIGLYAGRLPNKINHFVNNNPSLNFERSDSEIPRKEKKRKNKSWLLRPTGIIIITVSISVLIFTYVFPSSTDIAAVEIIVMLIRSLLLTLLWYLFLAPNVKRIFNKYLSGKKSVYAREIDEMMNMFPQFRNIVSNCWKNSQSRTGLKRIHYFLSTSFYYLLLSK